MDKTNVLILTSSLHIGGLEMVIAHLCRHSDRKKFDVSVCCLKGLGSIGEELIKEGYSVTTLRKPAYMKNNYISWLQVLSLTKKKNIHVIHSHTVDSLLDASLCKLFGWKIRTIHTFHYGNYPNLPSKYLFAEKVFSRFADNLVAVGNEQKEKITKALKIDDRSIVTVWNGVPKSQGKQEISAVEKYRQSERVIVGTVCTLIEQKGLTHLLDVAYSVKQKGGNALFLIAGEGHLRKDLEEKTTRLGLNDNVIFMGWVNNASQTFIPHIDIFFLPSLWEAMSVVVLEAMEAGKPVVVTNVGENRHVITDGVDGFLAEPGNTQRMADVIDRLIDNNDLRAQTGEKAREKIRSLFGVERMVSAYQSLYAKG